MTKRDRRKVWDGVRRSKTSERVGAFFERVVRVHFENQGFKISGICHNDAEGDLKFSDIGIDVKASDNNNKIRIKLSQMQRYLELSKGFPYKWFLYAICCWRNRTSGSDGKPRTSQLKGLRAKKNAELFDMCLASNLDTIYFLDVNVVEAIRKLKGSQLGLFPGDVSIETVSFGRALLKAFTVWNGSSVLSTLGLDPSEWVVIKRQESVTLTIGLYSKKITFTTVEVIPKKLQKKFRRMYHRIADERSHNKNKKSKILGPLFDRR